MEDIRDNLRLFIKDKGYKQTYIASRCDMKINTFNQVLTKKMRMSADLLFKVCDVLEITPDQLREYKSDEQKS